MRTVKSFSLIILTGFLLFTGCEGFMEPGSTAKQVTTPFPISPTDNTTGIYPAPAFQWSGEADKLQVSTNSNFSNIVFSLDVTNLQGYCMEGGILERGGLYFWRVGKSYGSDISWSRAFSFTIAP